MEVLTNVLGAGIDLSSLVVVEGKVCWDLYIDGLVVSSDGNLLDALGAAIKVFLLFIYFWLFFYIYHNCEGKMDMQQIYCLNFEISFYLISIFLIWINPHTRVDEAHGASPHLIIILQSNYLVVFLSLFHVSLYPLIKLAWRMIYNNFFLVLRYC